MSPIVKMGIGLAATVLSAWLFHGPAGYGKRLLDGIDAQIQPIVAKQDVPAVKARMAHDPMSRDLRFSGPANDFQRQGFVEVVQDAKVRGLRSIAWETAPRLAKGAPR